MPFFGPVQSQNQRVDTSSVIETFVDMLFKELTTRAPLTGKIMSETYLRLEKKNLLPTLRAMVAKQHISSQNHWHNLATMYYLNMYNVLTKLHKVKIQVPFDVAVDFIRSIQENTEFRRFLNYPLNGIRPAGVEIPLTDPLPIKYILPFLHAWPQCVNESITQPNSFVDDDMPSEKASISPLISQDDVIPVLTLLLRDVKNHQAHVEILKTVTEEINCQALTKEQVALLLADNLVPQSSLDERLGLSSWFDQFSQKPGVAAVLPDPETYVYYFLCEIELWEYRNNSSLLYRSLKNLGGDIAWRMIKRYLLANLAQMKERRISDETLANELSQLSLRLITKLLMANIRELNATTLADISNFIGTAPWNQYLKPLKFNRDLFLEFVVYPDNPDNRLWLRGYLQNIGETSAGPVLDLLLHHWENLKHFEVLCTLVANPEFSKFLNGAQMYVKFQSALEKLTLLELQELIENAHQVALPGINSMLLSDELLKKVTASKEMRLVCLKRGLLWEKLFDITMPLDQKLLIASDLIQKPTNQPCLQVLIQRINKDISKLCNDDLDMVLDESKITIYDLLRNLVEKKIEISNELWMAFAPVLKQPAAIFNLFGINERCELNHIDKIPPVVAIMFEQEQANKWIIEVLRPYLNHDNVEWLILNLPKAVLQKWLATTPDLVTVIKTVPDLARLALSQKISDEFARSLIAENELFSPEEWAGVLLQFPEPNNTRAMLLNKLKKEMRFISAFALVKTLLSDKKKDFLIALYERFNCIDTMRCLQSALVNMNRAVRHQFLLDFLVVPEFVALTQTFWSTVDLPVLELLKADKHAIDKRLLDIYLLPTLTACQMRHPLTHPLELLNQFALEHDPSISEYVLTAVTKIPVLRKAISKQILEMILTRPVGIEGIDQISMRQTLLVDKDITAKFSPADWLAFLKNDKIESDKILFIIAEQCLNQPAENLKAVIAQTKPEKRKWLTCAVMAKLASNEKLKTLKDSDIKIYQAYLKSAITDESSIEFYGIHDLPFEVFSYLHAYACKEKWVTLEYIQSVLQKLEAAPLERVERLLGVLPELTTITDVYARISTLLDDALRMTLLTLLACSVTALNKLSWLGHVRLEHIKEPTPFLPRMIVLTHIAKNAHSSDAETERPSKLFSAMNSSYCRLLAEKVSNAAPLTEEEMRCWLNNTNYTPKNFSLTLFNLMLPNFQKVKPAYFLGLLIHCPNVTNEMTIEIMRIVVEHFRVNLKMENLIREAKLPKEDTGKMEYYFARARRLYQQTNELEKTDVPVDSLHYDKYLKLVKEVNAVWPDMFKLEPPYKYISVNEEEKVIYAPSHWVMPLEELVFKLKQEEKQVQALGGIMVSETQYRLKGELLYLPTIADAMKAKAQALAM